MRRAFIFSSATATAGTCCRRTAISGATRRLYTTQPKAEGPRKALGVSKQKFYHLSSFGLAALIPLALVSPSSMVFPIDLALGVFLPLHAHIGMKHILNDYVPKQSRSAARWGLAFATGIAVAGLLKLNLYGSGVTSAAKTLWKKEPLTTTAKESSTA